MGRSLIAVFGLTLLLGGGAGAAVWKIEMVDQRGPGRFSTLRLDANGDAHLSYIVQDGDRFPLKYGFWDHSLNRWFLMTLAEGASFSSMALDSRHHPHVAWADYGTASGSKLRYAHWTGKEWLKQAIPLSSDVVAYYTSIALDSHDNPTISFYEYRGPKDTGISIRLRNVIWDGQQWEVRTVDSEEGSGKFNSTAVDKKDGIHIAYANVSASTSGLRYAYWDGRSWKAEIVDGLSQNNNLEGVGYSACIALDKAGNPHIVYTSQSQLIVKYAVRKDGKWQTQAVDQIGGAGYPDRNSIALDEDGQPYLSYHDARLGALKVAYREGTQWMVQTVDRNSVGFTSSIQVAHGTVWISYEDQGNGGVKVARLERDARSTKGDDPGTSRKPN